MLFCQLRRTMFVLLAVLGTLSVGIAQTVSSTVQVANVQGDSDRIDFGVDGSGTVNVLWMEYDWSASPFTSSISFSRSTDGLSYTAPLEVFPNALFPKMLVAPSGAVFALGRGGGSNGLWYSQSANGATFSPPVDIMPGRTLGAGIGYDAIFDAQGRVLVAAATQPPFETVRIEFTMSTDWVNFSSPIQLNTQSVYGSPRIVADTSGNIYVTYLGTAAQPNASLYFTRSSDGVNFSLPIAIAEFPSGSFSSDLAIDQNGAVHVVWVWGGGSNAEIYYSRSSDGTNFTVPRNLSNNPGSYEPRLVIDDNDTIHVSWSHFVSTSTYSGSIFYSRSLDGDSFSLPFNVSGPETPNIAAYSQRMRADGTGNVVLAWNTWDDTDFTGIIHYSRSRCMDDPACCDEWRQIQTAVCQITYDASSCEGDPVCEDSIQSQLNACQVTAQAERNQCVDIGFAFSPPLDLSSQKAPLADYVELILDQQGVPHLAWSAGEDYFSKRPYYAEVFEIAFTDVDGDGLPDVYDPCPADPLDQCNPSGSAAVAIPAAIGGVVETPDQSVELAVEPGDLSSDATISVTEVEPQNSGVDLSIGSGSGTGQAIAVYNLEPDGLQFDNPVTLTITADVTALSPVQRTSLDLYRNTDTDDDGIEDTFVAISGTTCTVLENPPGTFIATCSAEITHFSTYALVAPADADGDGVLDQFGDLVDVCPVDPNIVEGLLAPLVALVPESEPNVPLPEKALKQGRNVPLKLRFLCGPLPLTDASSAPRPEIVNLVRTDDAVPLAILDLNSGQANDSGTEFRYADDHWIYNLSTAELQTGTYVITIRMPDGRLFNGGFVLR